jgi:hypothetical protein
MTVALIENVFFKFIFDFELNINFLIFIFGIWKKIIFFYI